MCNFSPIFMFITFIYSYYYNTLLCNTMTIFLVSRAQQVIVKYVKNHLGQRVWYFDGYNIRIARVPRLPKYCFYAIKKKKRCISQERRRTIAAIPCSRELFFFFFIFVPRYRVENNTNKQTKTFHINYVLFSIQKIFEITVCHTFECNIFMVCNTVWYSRSCMVGILYNTCFAC